MAGRRATRRISSRIRFSTALRRYARSAPSPLGSKPPSRVTVRCSASWTMSLVSATPRAQWGRRPRAQRRSHGRYRANSASRADLSPRIARSRSRTDDVSADEPGVSGSVGGGDEDATDIGSCREL